MWVYNFRFTFRTSNGVHLTHEAGYKTNECSRAPWCKDETSAARSQIDCAGNNLWVSELTAITTGSTVIISVRSRSFPHRCIAPSTRTCYCFPRAARILRVRCRSNRKEEKDATVDCKRRCFVHMGMLRIRIAAAAMRTEPGSLAAARGTIFLGLTSDTTLAVKA
jgi:hypothetical protein